MHEGPISNGLLLRMMPEQRKAVIGELSPDMRRRLARIAALGADREVEKAVEHLDAGRRAWADAKLEHARSLSRLVAELTRIPTTCDPEGPQTPSAP